MALRAPVIDDHPLILEIVGAVLAKALDGPEVLRASDLPDALEQARATGRLDLVILDLGLPGCSGLEALTRFRKSFPAVPVVIYSAIDDPSVIRAARKAGARGYVVKTAKPPVIQAAFALAAAGEPFFPSETLAQRAPDLDLTDRQFAVLRRIIKGLPNSRIAKEMDITPNTVKQHAHAVFGKLGVSSRTEAIAAAARFGIK